MSYEYRSVNGSSCSYVRLGTYNKCSAAEAQATPDLSTADYVYKGNLPNAAQASAAATATQVAPVNPTMVSSGGAPVASDVANPAAPTVGVTEGFETPVDPAYVPHYNVPNYAPINTGSLTRNSEGFCGGYFNILTAYGSDAGNCVTSFIQN